MTEPHRRPHRYPKDKIADRVKNWREYDQALRDRGDITLWLSQDAIDTWTPPMTGKRGAQPVYSNLAIETALTLRLLFHLPLWQTEGFLHAVLTLMGVTLPCPDHTTLSRRNATVAIQTGATAPTPRDQQVYAIETVGRCAWKRTSGYYAQSHVENTFSRFKRTFGGALQAKRDASQEREASLVCQLLNRMRALGCPQSYPVS